MTREEMVKEFPTGKHVMLLESGEPVVIKKSEREVVRVGLSREKHDGKRYLGVYLRKPGSKFKGVWWPVTRLAPVGAE